jgi:DNA-binding NarL/FixJ family response regulator
MIRVMIRVMLVDDSAAVRKGLSELLQAVPGIQLVGSAPDGLTAIEMAGAVKPDVVLMDLSMPEVDGVEATQRILEDRPQTKVVVLTAFSEQPRIFAALDAGAVGYLLKDAEPDELVRGVLAAAAGESPFSPKAAAALVARRAEQRQRERLTDRERQVLSLVTQGLPNKAIARRLGVSEKTVKAHLTTVFTRIGVTDRTQAAVWALHHGVSERV